jgi:dTDP-4-amino-4,6-dideoxygalactose transaminase
MIIPRRFIDILPHELARSLKPPLAEEGAELIRRWQEEFARYAGRQEAIAVGSGRLAMKLILDSLHLDPGSEVIIPAYTLKDLIPIITGLGLVPVSADIDAGHWNITAATILPKLTPRTRAILALHLFGAPCPMPEIMALAAAHDLRVIEDCAHSAGSTIAGRQTGSFGHAAFFSFESIKPINTYGGGMVVSDDAVLMGQVRQAVAALMPPVLTKKMLAVRLERLLFASGLALIPLLLLASTWAEGVMTWLYRQLQHAPRQPWGYAPLQAALGLEKLATLDQRILQKRRQAAHLTVLLPPGYEPQGSCPGALPNHYFFVVKAPVGVEVRELRRRLLCRGFDAGVGDELADDCALLLHDSACPGAADLAQRAIHLPLHEGLTDHDAVRLARLLARFC